MAKKCKCPEPDGGGNFLVTFADLVTLLMAFFVLLFAMSTVDEAKFIVLLKGLEESFGNSTLQSGVLSGGDSILGANLEAGSAIPVPGGSMVLVSDDAVLEEPEVDPDDPSDGSGGAGGDDAGNPSDADAFYDREELSELVERLEAVLEEQGYRDTVNFRFNERGLVISIATDDVLFASGSAELAEGGVDILRAVTPELAEIDNVVFVDGHTDDIPFPGEGYTNLDLSTDRAVEVAKVLSGELDIAPDRLVPTGYAEWRPLVPNTSDENRAANRRVELVVAAGSTGTAEADAAAAAEAGEPTTSDDGPVTGGASGVEEPAIELPVTPDASSESTDVPNGQGSASAPDAAGGG